MYAKTSFEGFTILVILLLLFYLIAWALSMSIVANAAKDKGYRITGQLWFIGLFGFIFTPAIIVAALPDKVGRTSGPSGRTPIDDELPAL